MSLPDKPNTEHFSPVLSLQNLWRMRQFYEVYVDQPKLSPLVRVLSWTHNLIVLSKCKTEEERGFYLTMAVEQRWSKRELEQQINNALFERSISSPLKVSAALRELHPSAQQIFKDSYLFDFLHLPEPHQERDLQQGLIKHLKLFLLELGRDFCFIGQEFSVLLCKNRDHDVVEYALSRSLSPTVIAQYQTRLPDKALLQAKLDEFYELAKLESGQ